jgi:hypothetical protein
MENETKNAFFLVAKDVGKMGNLINPKTENVKICYGFWGQMN